MLCSKCNAELVEGAKFCSSCGSKVELAEVLAPEETPVVEDAPVEKVKEDTPVDANPVEESKEDAPVEESPVEEVKEDTPVEENPVEESKEDAPVEENPVEESKEETPVEETPVEEVKEETPVEEPKAEKPAEEVIPTPVLPSVTPEPEAGDRSSKKLLPKVVAAAAAIAVLAGFVTMMNKGGSNKYVYLSGGNYNLMTDPMKSDGFDFSSAKGSSPYPGNVKFTEDGKYIYFLSKVSLDDNYKTSGTLCRAQVNKLKKGSKKNEKYIETIASGVTTGFEVLKSGDVIYMNADDNLYYYDGKETTTIAKDVYDFTCESDYVLIASENSGDGTDVYYAEYKKPDGKEKIVSKCSSVLSYSDKDNIIYTKYEDDYTYSIYKTGLGKDSEKIASHADIHYITDMFGSDEPAFYYSVASDKTISLYDYVNDTFAEADKGVKEPDINDYTIPTYNYNMISDKNPKESDYGELYTSCTKNLYWYGTSKYWCFSMEDAIDEKWGEQTDNIVKATEAFMEKFSSKADENGYILVTEDVKAALKEINKFGTASVAKEKNAENQWLWLCFTKDAAGNTYDYDKYDEEYEKYRKVADRLYMRERLQDKDNDIKVKSLYYYKDGKSELVCDNVVNTREYSNMLVYNTADMVTEKLDIEDIEYYNDIRDLFNFTYDKNNYFVSEYSSSPVQLSDKVSERLADCDDYYGPSLYVVGEDLILCDDEEIAFAPIKKGKTENFAILTDDGTILSHKDGKLWYGADVSSGNVERGDIYTFEDGKTDKILSDVLFTDIRIYEDDSVLAYTDLRSGVYHELTYFDKKGKKTVIADDVTQYVRLSKKDILYIANGELYICTNKKKKNKSADGVEYVWTKECMEPEVVLGSYSWYY